MSGDAPQGAGAPAGPTALGLRIEAPGMRVALTVSAGDGARPVEVASPAGARGWAWTRKVAGLRATGTIEVHGRSRELELEAMIDDSAGYHPRHTAWQWSTGVGRTESGERVAWNLVAGVHDSAAASERTIWIDGEPCEVGPVRFADDLSSVALAGGGELAFEPLEAREHRTNLVLLRSAYRQPFGRFSGELPNGLRLRKGYGVMEKHDVHW